MSLDDAYAQLKTYMRHLPANDIFNFAARDLRNHIKKFADIDGRERRRPRQT